MPDFRCFSKFGTDSTRQIENTTISENSMCLEDRSKQCCLSLSWQMGADLEIPHNDFLLPGLLSHLVDSVPKPVLGHRPNFIVCKHGDGIEEILD